MNDIHTLAREAASTPFVTDVDGTELTLAHIADVDQFALADLYADNVNDIQFITGVLSLAAGDKVAQLRGLKLRRRELVQLHADYMRHCGTTAGESSASSS